MKNCIPMQTPLPFPSGNKEIQKTSDFFNFNPSSNQIYMSHIGPAPSMLRNTHIVNHSPLSVKISDKVKPQNQTAMGSQKDSLEELKFYKLSYQNQPPKNYKEASEGEKRRSLNCLDSTPKTTVNFMSDRVIIKNYCELLGQMQPSLSIHEEPLKNCSLDTSLKSSKSILKAKSSLFNKRTVNSRVRFHEEAEIREVENWKMFNVDMSQKLKFEALKKRKDFCLIF